MTYLAPFLQQGEDETHAGSLSQLALGLDSTAVGFGYGLRYRETEAAARLLYFGQAVEAFEDVWKFRLRYTWTLILYLYAQFAVGGGRPESYALSLWIVLHRVVLEGQDRLFHPRGVAPCSAASAPARDDTRNKVGALDAGADDYLTKPFVFEELLARVRALTRRSGQSESALIQTDGRTIDLLSRHAYREGESIELSSREFALLEYFMRHGGQVLSRQQILSAIWDYDFEPASNVVDVYVRHLRNKVDPPDGPSLIQTVRGAGYRFNAASNP